MQPAAPLPQAITGSSPFSPPPRNPAVAAVTAQQPQAGPEAPMNADDAEIVVTTRPVARTPFDAGLLAMDRAANPVKPAELTWGDRLQIAGATLQQMGRPDNQIATTMTGIRTLSREQAQEEERKRLSAAQIAGVRNIIDQERLRWEEDDNPAKPRWEQTWTMQMARLASSPDEFFRLYAARQEAEAGRDIQRSQLNQEGAQFNRAYAQRDRHFDAEHNLNQKQADRNYELGQGQLNVERTNAETRRRDVDNNINNLAGKDPLQRALLNADVSALKDMDDETEKLTKVAESLQQFGRLNAQQPTGFMASGTPILGIAPNQNFQQMQVIQNALFPVLGELIRGTLSETDAYRVERGTVHVDNSTETNQAIVRVGVEAARRAQERSTLAREYLRTQRNLDTFNRHWAAYVGEVSAWSDDPKKPPKTFAQWMRDKTGGGAQ
jgi:hypothetical protein